MITTVKKTITIFSVMNTAKIFLYTVVLLIIALAGCAKNEEPKDPYVYTGKEQPGTIPGFGSNIGEFQGHWFKLPSGVEYAGEIRGENFYDFNGASTPPVIGNGYYVKLTIPLLNPRKADIEFPAGMILVPILTDVSQQSPGTAEDFTVEFPEKPQIYNSILRTSTVAAEDGCGYSWLPDWVNDKLPDLFKPTGGCDGKNYKDPHQAGISPKKKKIPQWVNKAPPQGSSEIPAIFRASAADGLQYVTLHLYCVNENESRPSASTARFYRPFVTESPLLQWFFKMLEDKNIEDGNASDKIQGFIWKLTDGGEMLSDDDINYIKNLPKE